MRTFALNAALCIVAWGISVPVHAHAEEAPPARDNSVQRALIKWKPGEPPPAGYRTESTPRSGLLIGGVALFGSLYATSVTVAAVQSTSQDSDKLSSLYVPVVGPFLQMGRASGWVGPFLLVDGVAQVAGVSMLLAGLIFQHEVLVKDRAAAVTLSPRITTKESGLSLSGAF